MPEKNENPTEEEGQEQEQEAPHEFDENDVAAIMRMPDPFDSLGDEPEDEDGGDEPDAGDARRQELAEREDTAPAPAEDEEAPAPPAGAPDHSDRLAVALENIANWREEASKPKAPALDPKALETQLESHLDKLYQFNISPETVAALQSDDPGAAQQAIGKTMTTLAKLVHRNVAKETQAAFVDVLQKRVPQLIDSAIQQDRSRQTMNIDFYSHYPELSAPELGEVVRGTFNLLLQENPAMKKQGWSPEFRDKLGDRVLKALGVDPAERRKRMKAQEGAGGSASAPSGPRQRAVPKAPNLLNGRTSRPGNPADRGGPNTQADIMNTLF